MAWWRQGSVLGIQLCHVAGTGYAQLNISKQHVV
jgi:hypothetical protein